MWFLSNFCPVVYYLYSHITQHVYSRMLWFLKDVFISAEHPLKVLCYLSIFLYACNNLSTAEHVFMIQCWGVYRCLLSHVNFHVNKTVLATTFHENLHVFSYASCVICPSVYACNNLSTAEHVFMIQCWGVYRCLLNHVNFHVNKTVLATTFYENLHVFSYASCVICPSVCMHATTWVLLNMFSWFSVGECTSVCCWAM